MSFNNIILNDLADCLKNSRIWLILSFYDIKTRYRRTAIGPFWLSLGTGVTILGLGLVWGAIFELNLKEFFPYIATGMIIWTFIASILTESCSVFISQASVIHNVKISYLVHIMTMISRNIIIFLHNMIVVVFVYIYFGKTIGFEALLFFPGMLMLLLNGFLYLLIKLLRALCRAR